MKCPICDGMGTSNTCVNGTFKPCSFCDGTGEVQTNEEMLRGCTFEELAGAIYEWHTKGYARGRLEVDLNPITELVEWLKQPHTKE